MIEINITKPLHTADGMIDLVVEKEIANGDFLTLFGKSGSGKTTLLRILAGLETPKYGRIVVDGDVWFDSEKKINLPPQKRKIGFVFQDYALFANMSVRENLQFAQANQKQSQKVDEMLEIMELGTLAKMMPNQLSGGQKQRVALARALMSEPKMLLLDEPLSALDHTMRTKLQEELLAVHKRFGITSILVSHDIGEVFKLSNRVLKITQGQIVDDGTPEAVFASANISGKFKVVGEVIDVVQADLLYIVSIMSNGEVIKITALEDEVQNLKIGEKVLVSSKAFNPIFVRL